MWFVYLERSRVLYYFTYVIQSAFALSEASLGSAEFILAVIFSRLCKNVDSKNFVTAGGTVIGLISFSPGQSLSSLLISISFSVIRYSGIFPWWIQFENHSFNFFMIGLFKSCLKTYILYCLCQLLRSWIVSWLLYESHSES